MAKQPDNKNNIKVKSPATVEAQIEKLRSRGCVIDDEDFAKDTLKNINYYRLAHYFSVFLDKKNKYRDGTTFEKVLAVYDFDRMLRSLLLSMLEEVEITMRANVSNYHALKFGALGYLNESSFDYHHNHKSFVKKIERMIDSNNGEAIVEHHKNKYGGAFPLWVIMELFSFGMLNFFYCDLRVEDKREIAESAFGLHYRAVESWLKCLSDLRNHCAHYNRLYGNDFEDTPKQPSDMTRPISNTLFDYILILKRLYPRKDSWNGGFVARLSMLLLEYKDVIELKNIGFPDDWLSQLTED